MKSNNNTSFLLLALLLITESCIPVQSHRIDTTGSGQSDALFSLKNGDEIYADEFIYAYQKNNFNNEEANTKKDIEEYLDLYIIFKQKVQVAKDLGMDTTSIFLKEFNGYKESLADSYVNSKDLTDKLIEEAYERYKEEVAASHILIKVTNQEDTLAAYQKIDSIRQLAINGADFSLLAKNCSEDPSAKVNAGDLGYFTSMRMVYPFESGAYNTSVGQVSEIVRTRFGYHILYIRDRRPSQGKVSVSHIMVRTNTRDTDEKKEIARNKIFEIQDQLNNGVEWDFLCKQFSEDQNTKNKSGKLTPFGSGQMPPALTQAAFDLQNPGDYSDPITSPYGWHIIKLNQKLAIESYDVMKSKIKNHISRDERVSIIQKALVKKLKKENSFFQINANLTFDKIDSTLLAGKWEYKSSLDTATLFTINKEKYSKKDYYTYVTESQKPVRGKSLKSYNYQLYDKYVAASLVQYEKDHLDEKNVEYRMLVKEYWEGILLFNLMNEKVWEKAVKDTTGLQSFFSENREDYRWDNRIKATIYNVANKKIIDQINTLDSSDTIVMKEEYLLKKFNDTSDLMLKIDHSIYEKKDLNILDQIPWQVGKHEIAVDGRFYLVNIEEVIPSKLKGFKECKGLVIADYQKKLERDWVTTLNQQYPHEVNKAVWSKTLKSLEK